MAEPVAPATSVDRPAAELDRERPAPDVERPELDQGGPSDMAHYARNDELAAARRQGRPVKALCGTLFVPHSDPTNLPVCVVCQDLAASWSR